MNREYWYTDKELARGDAIIVSEQLLNDGIDFLYGVRLLSELYDPLESEFNCDLKLFSTFQEIDEKTFHIPCHSKYDLCSKELVQSTEDNKKALKDKYQDLVKNKCKALIDHFKNNI